MYVLVERPGLPPQRIKVEGNEAVVGRAPHCDVVIDEQFVSKQHLRVFAGLVAVDVSSNGTFVDGQRIDGGIVAKGKAMQLADSDITLRVEADEPATVNAPKPIGIAPPTPAPAAPPAPAAAPAATPDSVVAKQTGILRDQLADAAKRLKTKTEACQKLEAELKKNADMVAAATGESAKLRQEAAELHKRIAELEENASEPAPPPDGNAAGLLLFNVQRENAQLKKQLAEQKAAVAAEAAKAATAQSEAAKQVAAARAAAAKPDENGPQLTTPAAPPRPAAPTPATPTPPQPAAPVPPPKAPTGKAVAPLPFDDATDPPADPAVTAPASEKSPTASNLPDPVIPMAKDAAMPMAAGGPAPAGDGELNTNRLLELLQQDAEAMAVRPDDPMDAFLLVEGFRFMRRMERVITRLAGGLIQLYQQQTMVPGIGGNLRQLLAEVAANPDKQNARQDLLNYLRELGRWMVVALSAYRKAAEGFAKQMKEDLTPEALTSSDPISIVKRATGGSDAELWKRVCDHMKTLSQDEITERVEKLAREAAEALTDGDLADSEEASFG